MVSKRSRSAVSPSAFTKPGSVTARDVGIEGGGVEPIRRVVRMIDWHYDHPLVLGARAYYPIRVEAHYPISSKEAQGKEIIEGFVNGS